MAAIAPVWRPSFQRRGAFGTLAIMTKIAVIGGGKIGTALISGLIEGGNPAADISVADAYRPQVEKLAEELGITPGDNPADAAQGADVVVICVKPDVVATVLDEITPSLEAHEGEPVVVSMAAGITIDAIDEHVPGGTPVIRVMPNTPMLVGRGVSAIAPGRFASEDDMDLVASLLEKVGIVERVKESQLDAVTAMSGSGPAYFFQYIEAMSDAGVFLGLPRDQAQRLASATMAGAAEMLMQEGADPTQLRVNVSSPGGTTAAGTRALEEAGIRTAVYRGLQATHDRSVELGK